MQGTWAFAPLPLPHPRLPRILLPGPAPGKSTSSATFLVALNFSARASNNFLSCSQSALLSLLGAFSELRALVTFTEGVTKSIILNMFSGQVVKVETAVFVPLP